MKKLFILSLAIISFSAGFAQDHGKSGYTKRNDQSSYNQRTETYKGQSWSTDHRYNGNDQQISKRQTRSDIGQFHQGYDQNKNSYGSGHSMYAPERGRGFHEPARSGLQKGISPGQGLFAGAVIGMIAGALLSR